MNKKIDKAVKASIKDIDHKFLRKSAIVAGLIEKVVQTGGPTVFTLRYRNQPGRNNERKLCLR